jgi:hypothetical protein
MTEEEILEKAKAEIKKIMSRKPLKEEYRLWAELEEIERGDRSGVDTRLRQADIRKDSDKD